MVGLGEEQDELVQVFKDLRQVGVAILTIGQYLRPSADHAPMTRYYHPDEFAELEARSRSAWASSTSRPARWCAARTTRTNRPTPPRTRWPAERRRPGRAIESARFPADAPACSVLDRLRCPAAPCSPRRAGEPRRRRRPRATRRSSPRSTAASRRWASTDFAGAVDDVLGAGRRASRRRRRRREPRARAHQSPGRVRCRRGRAVCSAALVSDATVGTRAKYALGLLRLYAGRDAEAAAAADRGGVQRPRRPLPRLFRRPGAAGQRPRAGPGVVRQGPGPQPAAAQRLLRRLPGAAAPGPRRRGGPRLAQFQALERDPRAEMAEFKYTRMGPLAMAVTLDASAGSRIPRRSHWFRRRRLPPRQSRS